MTIDQIRKQSLEYAKGNVDNFGVQRSLLSLKKLPHFRRLVPVDPEDKEENLLHSVVEIRMEQQEIQNKWIWGYSLWKDQKVIFTATSDVLSTTSKRNAEYLSAFYALRILERKVPQIKHIRIEAHAWYLLRHLDPKLRPVKFQDFNALTFLRENNLHVVNRFPVPVQTKPTIRHGTETVKTPKSEFVGGVRAAFYTKLRGSNKYLVKRAYK